MAEYPGFLHGAYGEINAVDSQNAQRNRRIKQAFVYRAFAGFRGHKAPQMTHLCLSDTVNATKALFQSIGIPRQVVVNHKVGVL